LKECLPNITGSINFLSRELGASGAFWTTGSYAWRPAAEGGWEVRGLAFEANRGASKKDVYKDNCKANRPLSYGVYIWIRTS